MFKRQETPGSCTQACEGIISPQEESYWRGRRISVTNCKFRACLSNRFGRSGASFLFNFRSRFLAYWFMQCPPLRPEFQTKFTLSRFVVYTTFFKNPTDFIRVLWNSAGWGWCTAVCTQISTNESSTPKTISGHASRTTYTITSPRCRSRSRCIAGAPRPLSPCDSKRSGLRGSLDYSVRTSFEIVYYTGNSKELIRSISHIWCGVDSHRQWSWRPKWGWPSSGPWAQCTHIAKLCEFVSSLPEWKLMPHRRLVLERRCAEV